MKISRQIQSMVLILMMASLTTGIAHAAMTKRISQINNTKVNVWKTIIYPTKKAQLTMLRHDYDRVVVALTDGLLKVTNSKEQVHYLKLEKGMSYYLKKDPEGELHVDENMTKHPVSVVVIELK